MTKKCLCKNNEKVLVFPCSGGSNCGQISNQVAIEITEDGVDDGDQYLKTHLSNKDIDKLYVAACDPQKN